jgi:hypothetical protein
MSVFSNHTLHALNTILGILLLDEKTKLNKKKNCPLSIAEIAAIL